MKDALREIWLGFLFVAWPWETPYLFGRFLGYMFVCLFWAALLLLPISLFVGAVRIR